MSLIVLGINHKTAPLAVREKAAFADHQLAQAMADLRRFLMVTLERSNAEVAILSTCNRVELTVLVPQVTEDIGFQATKNWLHQWLAAANGLTEGISDYLYVHAENDAVRHTMRVASGLDSLVLGEPQILGQLKACYQKAKRAGTLGKELERLYQKSFAAAKKVRHETEIGANPVSVAFAAVNLAKHIFSDFSSLTVLLVGAGETIELAARHLAAQGVVNMVVANRTLTNAHELAAHFNAKAIGLEAIPHYLSSSDIVVSSTGSMLPIIGKGMVEAALKQRKYGNMFMVDLAVPRDIEASVADLDDVYLYTVDDLEGVIQENMQARQEAAEQAEVLLEPLVSDYLAWRERLKQTDTVLDLQQRYQQIVQDELQRAKAQLHNSASPAEAEASLESLSYRLMKKFLHQPLVWLGQPETGTYAELDKDELTRELFQLDQGLDESLNKNIDG